ncbi:type II toxin-antitoxin system RelE/ParE family toxin, partial [Candidatus Poribacteria bacterium]|nr:type II toxin-antitoxin system RelE/ParE family toxin [Candidatus Poribacteria bacterium]
VGAYRILYRIDDENYRVKIYRIKHRGSAYR